MRSTSLAQEEVRVFALTLPEAHASSHHGTPDVRVRNRIFASFPPGAAAVALKIAPQNLEFLVRRNPRAFQDAWRGRWLTVQLGAVDLDVVHDLVVDSWSLAAPKSVVRNFRR